MEAIFNPNDDNIFRQVTLDEIEDRVSYGIGATQSCYDCQVEWSLKAQGGQVKGATNVSNRSMSGL